jgi:N1-aminopropylagmatine ureohydrolase
MVKKRGYGDVPKGYDGYDTSKIVILPVPYDETSTWMKGADKGPDAISEASWNMYLYDIETDTEVYKNGIFTDSPVHEKISPEFMISAVRDRAAKHLAADKFIVTVGGEHSVSIGAVQAHSSKFSGLSVLQLDAHADLQNEFNGSRFNHACVMARIKESCPVVQVGIRSMDSAERAAADPDRIFYAEDIHGRDDWMERAVSLLSDRVYITIDVDCFDISIMPATGTPEPGGLLWYDVIGLLRTVARKKKIVGFDVVELCPNQFSKHCDFLAAKLIYRLLSYVFLER